MGVWGGFGGGPRAGWTGLETLTLLGAYGLLRALRCDRAKVEEKRSRRHAGSVDETSWELRFQLTIMVCCCKVDTYAAAQS